MSSKMKQTFKMTALAAALAASYGTALADDDEKAALAAVAAEVSRLTTPESSVSVGIGNWSGDRHQQGIYDGMREGKAYGLLDLTLVKRDNATGTWFTLEGRNLGLDTHELSAEWLRQGDIGISLDYSRIQRDNPLTFTTGLLGIGTANQIFSGTAGANTLPSRDVSLSTKRDLTQLGLYKNLMPHLNLKVSFKNEEKNGARQWGLGSNAIFLTEPIDSTVRQLEAILDYADERLQISGGYYGSWYDNANSLVLGYQNGLAISAINANPTNPTSLSLPLGNQAHQLFMNAGYAFTPTTRGTFKLSYGKATQDETIPVAFNVAPATAAPSNLNGRIDTSLAEFGLTSRPLPKLSLVANLRYHDVKDKTPVAAYIGPGPSGGGTTLVYNTPHSYTKTSGKVEANYRLPQQFNLIGGIEINNQDRSVPTRSTVSGTGVNTYGVPFRVKLDETTYRLQLRRSLSDTLNGSLAYLNSDRRGPGYVPTGNNPASNSADLVNPTHIADRKRDKWRAMLDWSPTERLSFQFAVDQAQDKYGPGNRPYGLVDGSADIYTLDVNYTMSDNWQISGWYTRDDTKAREVGALLPISATTTRDAQLREIGDSFGFGLRGRPSAKLQVGANLEWVKSVSQYPQTLNGAYTPTTAAGVSLAPLADITNKLTRLKLFGDYALDKNSNVRIEAIHERWQTDDWTWSFSTGAPFTYGTTTDGTTVTANPKQAVNFVGARYIYKF
ncbi:MAG: MtrB/PioB family decaheme-associated outer membrane protein [Rhodocyclaceae bacterium]|jgi:MtrB/PioB family decaheme-associated outer membrane protein|nr:MtrB/PioB family decaheme-associated outer membrane protein [Rhodocyclaceae bacterium]